MPLTQFHENKFQQNLENSLLFVKGRDLNNYWLNKNGTITQKSSWLGRVIRWIQNLFFDKTIKDIWSVFHRAVVQFEASRASCEDFECDSLLNMAEANAFVAERRERLRFVVKFLMSRKNKFDRFVKKSPKHLAVLKHYIDKYNKKTAKVAVAPPSSEKNEIDLTTKQPEESSAATTLLMEEYSNVKSMIKMKNSEGLKKLVYSLENVYLPSVNKKFISKRPPPLVIAVSPETDEKLYNSLDIKELVARFFKIPLPSSTKDLAKELRKRLNNKKLFCNVLAKQIYTEYKELEKTGKKGKTYEEIYASVKKLSDEIDIILGQYGEISSTPALTGVFDHIMKTIIQHAANIENGLKAAKENPGVFTAKAIADEILNGLLKGIAVPADPSEFSSLKEVYVRSSNLRNMIKKVVDRDGNVFGVNSTIHDKYYDQMELFLKNILYLIDHNNSIPPSKKESVLTELAIAGGECGARWIEETKKQYRSLTILENSELEVKVLEHVQGFKEDLFLELFQNLTDGVEYHILDSFRTAFGKELGLDDSTVDLDVFTYDINKTGLSLLKSSFLHAYKSPRIVKGVTERINLQLENAFEPIYFTYLTKMVEKQFPKLEDPSDYVMKHYMGKDYKSISEGGTLALLLGLNLLHR